MKVKVKKRAFIVLMGIGLVLAGIIINFIPAWNLKTADMNALHGDWINVYYETEKDAAEDVFLYADVQTASVAEKLGFSEKQNVNVYIYPQLTRAYTPQSGIISVFSSLFSIGVRSVRLNRLP